MKKENESLSEKQGATLLELARNTISERIGVLSKKSTDLNERLKDAAFDLQRGTFVTLKINQHLRGCIGNLTSETPIRDGVVENALNAAFCDPRFPPLTREELDSVQIEISLLTEPSQLSYTTPQELLDKLTPGVDGVIIRKGARSATFLPQVWDQLPDKEAFLGHLCLKAGLDPDAWKKQDLLVYTYRVEYFEEPQ